ncbi:hypothetical protein AB0K60_27535 [Thermopolyspora sp. NPDC052614]|uniref:hypothetical protein n=1 Tax=Thermopolyspora sp. NPDC052614 TaxID=3155682 RepID=UPI003428CBBB
MPEVHGSVLIRADFSLGLTTKGIRSLCCWAAFRPLTVESRMTASDRVQEMPADVRTARRLLWMQVTTTAAVIALVLMLQFLTERMIAEDDANWSSGALYFRIGYVLLLGTLAANLATRLRWVRNLTAIAELLYIADWASSLIIGYPYWREGDAAVLQQDTYDILITGVGILTWAGMILAAIAVSQLFGGRARSWFDRSGG